MGHRLFADCGRWCVSSVRSMLCFHAHAPYLAEHELREKCMPMQGTGASAPGSGIARTRAVRSKEAPFFPRTLAESMLSPAYALAHPTARPCLCARSRDVDPLNAHTHSHIRALPLTQPMMTLHVRVSHTQPLVPQLCTQSVLTTTYAHTHARPHASGSGTTR